MADNLPEIMKINEAAQYLRISSSSLYKLAQEGKIPAQKVGKHWRFHKQTLDKWFEKFPADELKNLNHIDKGGSIDE
jgi:excisionase family DNA binding protein